MRISYEKLTEYCKPFVTIARHKGCKINDETLLMAKFISCCPSALEQQVLIIPAEQMTQANALDNAQRRRIAWIQESESNVLMRHGRQVLKYGGHFNDRNGYLSSLTDAYREARQLAEYYELTDMSFESIVVHVRFIQVPVICADNHPIKFSWRQPYRQYELLDHRWQAFDLSKHPLVIKRQIIAQDICAWSSQTDLKNSRSVLHNFRETWDFSKRPRVKCTKTMYAEATL